MLLAVVLRCCRYPGNTRYRDVVLVARCASTAMRRDGVVRGLIATVRIGSVLLREYQDTSRRSGLIAAGVASVLDSFVVLRALYVRHLRSRTLHTHTYTLFFVCTW